MDEVEIGLLPLIRVLSNSSIPTTIQVHKKVVGDTGLKEA